MLDLPTLQSAWHLPPILSTHTPETGTIHQTLLLTTATANYALRAYRYSPEQRIRIAYEHDLIRYAHARGLPALLPLPLPETGESIFTHENRFYALFPFAPGYQNQRGQLTPSETATLGSFLAQTHIVLHSYPQHRVHQRTFSINSSETLAKIALIEATIHKIPSPTPADRNALTYLAQHRTWIEENPTTDNLLDFSRLEQQVIHGDYQDTNVFFTTSTPSSVSISAIIDWDQAYIAPRAWEIIRTLDYVGKLEPSFCSTFIHAYRILQPISAEDLHQTALSYGLKKAHDVWMHEMFYLEKNERIAVFMNEEFVPFIDRWETLSASFLLKD